MSINHGGDNQFEIDLSFIEKKLGCMGFIDGESFDRGALEVREPGKFVAKISRKRIVHNMKRENRTPR